ncbi:MAG: hypothetical protein P4M08_09340 [Oligoflexia bacterium]|nr:hypothetical protein [Oligoflexia bacterium]
MTLIKNFRAFGLVIALCVFQTNAESSDVFKYELNDWVNKSTGTTASLNRSCDVLVEGRLNGYEISNLVFLGFKNLSKDYRYVDLRNIHFKFDNGQERFSESPGEPMRLDPNLTRWASSLFPEKADFKGARKIEVEIPILDEKESTLCTVYVDFEREAEAKELETSNFSYTSFDMDFEVGGTLYRGNLSNVGGRTVSGGIALEKYYGISNGWLIDILFDGFTSPNYSALSQATGSSVNNTRSVLGVGVFAAYSRRDYLSQKWFLTESVGPGVYSLNYYQGADANSDSSSSFAMLGRFGVDYQLSRVSAGFFRGIYTVGLSAYDVWIPHGNINGALDFSGQDIGLLARFKMGF